LQEKINKITRKNNKCSQKANLLYTILYFKLYSNIYIEKETYKSNYGSHFQNRKKKRNEKENKKEKSLAIYDNITITKSNRRNKKSYIFFAVDLTLFIFTENI